MRTRNLNGLGYPNVTVYEDGTFLDSLTGKSCKISGRTIFLTNQEGITEAFTRPRLFKACFNPPWENGIASINLSFLGLSNYYATEEGEIFGLRNAAYISQNTTHDGYRLVNLTNDYKDYQPWRVHRLIALAFIPNPDNKDTVNHIDGDKTNNCPGNLEWAWMWENVDHRRRMNGGVTDEQIHLVCKELEKGFGYVTAARNVGVPNYVAKDLLRGSYYHIAKDYKFSRYTDQSRKSVYCTTETHVQHGQSRRIHELVGSSTTSP